jgi:glycolate oxidase
MRKEREREKKDIFRTVFLFMLMLEAFEKIVGRDFVLERNVEGYLKDESAKGAIIEPCRNIVVVKPANTKEVSEVMKIAHANKVPVYPRGGGTGLVGGAVPVKKGIVLSLERMKGKGVEIDEDNLMCTVDSGITLGELEEYVDKHNLFFPPHPGDEGAQIGGLIACNAGGSRAVKYGVMRNYVKGLEVVLADGTVLNLGGKLLKNNTGYDLMDLFMGSEGTLGIITKAVLKLYPKPGSSVTLIIPFDDRHTALSVVPKMLQRGITPLAVEYVERDLVELSAEHLGLKWPCDAGKAQLMVIIAENNEDATYAECERISEFLGEGGKEIIIADRKQEQDEILKIRSSIYTALKEHTLDILDVSVPPSAIGNLMDCVDTIASEHGTRIPLYGHAADGNLHAHIMDDVELSKLQDLKKKIYEKAIELGGTITAEHGIGKVRRGLLTMAMDEKCMELSKAIKNALDPENILNPDCKI